MRILLLLVFLLIMWQSKADTETADTEKIEQDIIAYIDNEERLFKIVNEFVDNQLYPNVLTSGEVSKFDKLLKQKNASDQKLMIRMLREMNGITDQTEPEYVMIDGVLTEIEDTVVTLRSRFGEIEEDPSSFSIGDIQYRKV